MGRELPYERLARLRAEEHKLTQKKIADYLGCDVKTYRSWESGATPLSDVRFLCVLADLYHVSTDYLLCRTDDMNIGNGEIAEATGLSEASIELLRFLHRIVPGTGNLNEYQSDTIRFLNRALESAAPAVKRTGDSFPVYTIFSEMERYVNSDSTVVVHADGDECGSISFRDGTKLYMENAGRLYRESVITAIRKELDSFREVAKNG